ncbi:MAG: hypothetical protein WBQ94_02630, partial [Terracidiphilus sp.]
MHSFRLRLIIALITGITLVSVGSTYFEVLAHKHMLRVDLQRRTAWLGASMQLELEQAMAAGRVDSIEGALTRLRQTDGAMGLAVYTPEGRLLASSGSGDVFQVLSPGIVDKVIQQRLETSGFGHDGDRQWLEEAVPLHDEGGLSGVLVILEDAGYIRAEGSAVWQRSFWRIVAFVVLIVAVTLVMVRWFLMEPITRVAERLRLLRMGHVDEVAEEAGKELSLFTPLTREVVNMAESLIAAPKHALRSG